MNTSKRLTISSIKRLNRAAGYCYFSTATMRYWSSRTYPVTTTCKSAAATLFVTSEAIDPCHPEKARFTICRFDHATCNINTASGFMEFDTAAEAIAEMHTRAATL